MVKVLNVEILQTVPINKEVVMRLNVKKTSPYKAIPTNMLVAANKMVEIREHFDYTSEFCYEFSTLAELPRNIYNYHFIRNGNIDQFGIVCAAHKGTIDDDNIYIYTIPIFRKQAVSPNFHELYVFKPEINKEIIIFKV